MYDIAIIGLGPAGATLARLLNSKYKVIAIDKKDTQGGQDNLQGSKDSMQGSQHDVDTLHSSQNGRDRGFRKPCGGLLAVDAQKSLSKFNLTLPKDILVDPQIFAVRTVDTKQNLQRYYQRFYMNMDRHKFDLWLMSLIPESVDVMDRACCTEIKRTDGVYTITFRRDSELHTVQAKYIVGADGAASLVRRTLFHKKKIRQYVSIQKWYVDHNIRPLYSCFFDSDITDCYGWSVSKDGYFIVGGAFPASRSKERFEALQSKLESRGYVFGDVVKTEACVVLRPYGFFDHCSGKDNAFLIGEAAGFISPSSLEGISHAFNSAAELASVFDGKMNNPNREYSRKVRKIRIKLVLKNMKSFFMYFPPARWLVMKSKLQSIDVIEHM